MVDGFSVEGGLDGLSKKDRAYAEVFLEEYPNGFDVPEGCTDIVQVAQSQVGNVGGRKYWSWYGFNSRVEWCACFVSWCGNQCGYIADGKMPRFAGVGVGVDWFKKAALYLYAMMRASGYKEITHEQGNDEEYIVWMIGNCKWSLDQYCEEKPNVSIDLDSLDEDDIRDEEDYLYLTMRQKSEVLGVEILAHSWSGDGDFDRFDHYVNGKLISSESENYYAYPAWENVEEEFESYKDYCEAFDIDPNIDPPTWDKSEFESYEEFCKEYGIDPQKVPEYAWVYVYEDTYCCIYIDPPEHVSKFKFDF